MQPKYQLNDRIYQVTPVRRSSDCLLEIEGQQLRAQLQWHDQHQCDLTINGHTQRVYVAQDDSQLFIHLDGTNWELTVIDEFSEAAESGSAGNGQVKAPMPGVVVELNAREGQNVEEGDCLLLIESMKLQMEIKATVAGEIARIHVDGAGASFDKGSVLVEISEAVSP